MTGKFPALFDRCVFWWPGFHCAGYTNDFDEFPIIPSSISPTNNGSWTKISLGNNRSALVFNGSSNCISLPDHTDFDFVAGNFTILLFIKRGSLASRQFVMGQSDSNGSDASISWLLAFDVINAGNNYLYFRAYDSISSLVFCTMTIALIADTTEWYSIVLRRSGTVFDGFQSGSLIATNSPLSNTIKNSANAFSLGRLGEYNGSYFNGNMVNIMLLKRAISDNEIVLYNRVMHPVTGLGAIPGPHEYWRLS